MKHPIYSKKVVGAARNVKIEGCSLRSRALQSDRTGHPLDPPGRADRSGLTATHDLHLPPDPVSGESAWVDAGPNRSRATCPIARRKLALPVFPFSPLFVCLCLWVRARNLEERGSPRLTGHYFQAQQIARIFFHLNLFLDLAPKIESLLYQRLGGK